MYILKELTKETVDVTEMSPDAHTCTGLNDNRFRVLTLALEQGTQDEAKTAIKSRIKIIKIKRLGNRDTQYMTIRRSKQ